MIFFRKDNWRSLEKIVDRLFKYLGPDSNLLYSHFDSWQELERVLLQVKEYLSFHDYQAFNHLNELFAPTGDLQEIAMTDGWSQQYLELGREVDKFVQLIKDEEGWE